MKIAIINTWENGAIWNLMKPLAREVGADLFTIRDDISKPGFDLSFADYDIVHVGYFMNLQAIKNDIEVPFTCNVHHIPPHRLDQTALFLTYHNPSAIITADPFVQRQLGQIGMNGLDLIPYAFDHEGFELMDPPKEFSIGYIGCDSEAKRFNVIEEAASMAGVKSVGIDRATKNEEEDFLDQSKVLDMYQDMSVYVSAGWNDGGPLPPQEALLCGRPVISTYVGMMPQVIKPYENGLFFDGTVKDLVKQIGFVQDNYETFREGAMNTELPTTHRVAKEYMEVWERILAENE